MALNDGVVVKIVGDASGVQPAVQEVGVSLGTLEPMLAELNASVKALTAQMAEGFTAGAASAKQLAVGLEETNVAAKSAGSSIGEMSERLRLGGLSVGIFEKAFLPIVGIVAAAFAVDKIEGFIDSMGKAAEATVHLGQTLGLTVAQVQELKGISTGTGVSIETVAKGLEMLDNRALHSAASTSSLTKALHAVGVSANDGRSNMERLFVIADKFHELPDGPTKTALAMQLMSRGAGAMIPVLDQGREGLQALIDKTREYGGVNEEAVARGEELAKAVNESKMAWDGLKLTLMDELAPLLTEMANGFDNLIAEMTQSYNTGGLVKQVFDGLTDAGRTLGGVLSALGPIFATLGRNITVVIRAIEALVIVMTANFVRGIALAIANSAIFTTSLFAIEAAAGGAATGLEALALVAATTGRALLAALGGPIGLAVLALTAGIYELLTATEKEAEATGRFSKAQQDAKADSEKTTTALQDLATAHGEARKQAEAEAEAHLHNAEAKLKDAQATVILATAEANEAQQRYKEEEAATTPTVGMGSAGTAGMGFNPSAAVANNAKQQADANLKAAKDAAASYQKQIADLQKGLATPPANYGNLDLSAPSPKAKDKKDQASIMEQWKQELSDMLIDEKNWGADEAQLSLQFWESKLALTKKGSKEEIAVRREISHEKLALFKEEQADELANIKQHEALQLDAAKTDIALQRATLQEKLHAIDEEEKRGQISATKAIALRNQVNRQLYALDAQEAQAEYAAHLETLQAELKLEHLKPAQRKEINREIELLEKQHLDRMLLLNKQYDMKVKADADKLRDQQIADVRRVTDAYTQSIAKLLTLQQGFITTGQQLWQSLQQSIAGILDKILEKFVINEAIKLGLIKTTGQTTIASEAAKAGAGGVASMAAAPWPIDMGAPAFGTAMSTAAMAFSSLQIAEGGDWHVRDGLYRLHENEMVLPAWAAQGVRGMIAGQSPANSNAPSPANDGRGGGDVHLHLHSVIPPKPQEMRRFFEDHHQAIGAGVRKYVRQGGNTSPNR